MDESPRTEAASGGATSRASSPATPLVPSSPRRERARGCRQRQRKSRVAWAFSSCRRARALVINLLVGPPRRGCSPGLRRKTSGIRLSRKAATKIPKTVPGSALSSGRQLRSITVTRLRCAGYRSMSRVEPNREGLSRMGRTERWLEMSRYPQARRRCCRCRIRARPEATEGPVRSAETRRARAVPGLRARIAKTRGRKRALSAERPAGRVATRIRTRPRREQRRSR